MSGPYKVPPNDVMFVMVLFFGEVTLDGVPVLIYK